MGIQLSFSFIILISQLWAYAKSSAVDVGSEYQRELGNSFVSEASNFQINPVIEWPDRKIILGQVSGVALDASGNVYVFHRGPRIWDTYTFDRDNVYALNQQQIAEPTVAVIHPVTGDLIYEWGRQMFYLPHGITVDHLGNVWLTDVAMHQVFKFPPILNSKTNNTVPLKVLGSKLQPGNGKYTYCKPTAVAVMSTGEFFVSDGYCNARVIKYDADGNFLVQWGRNSLSIGPTVPIYQFNIPHDLSLAEEKNLLFVSDRENGRIQCFLASNGSYVYQIQAREIGSRLFGASYTPADDGLLFIVNGPEMGRPGAVHGSVVTASRDFRLLATFQPQTDLEPSFKQPHDVIVSPNGTSLYVTELDPFRVWKFDIVGLRPAPVVVSKNSIIENENQKGSGKTSGTMLMAIFITAIVLCFGAVLLTTAMVYSRAKTRVRMVYSHEAFAENFSSHLKSDSFKFTDDERLGVLRVMQCQEAKLAGETRPETSSSEESECGEDPLIRYTEKSKNVRKKLFASLVKEHIQRVFPALETYLVNRVPNYSIKEDAALLARTANVPTSLLKMWGCSGHCKNPNWLVGRSTVDGFKLGNFLGQQNQGFVKLNNLEESDEDDANVSPTTFA